MSILLAWFMWQQLPLDLDLHGKTVQNVYIYIYILVNSQITKTGKYSQQLYITVEFALKNSTECKYILINYQSYQNRLVQSPNRHYS